jgi:membrane protein YdbS with pleckstrin-like domain
MKEEEEKKQYNKLDRNWRVNNLLKLFFVIILVGILVYVFPMIARMFNFSNAPIFNISSQIWLWVISLVVLVIVLYIVWIFLFYNSFWYKLEKESIRIHKGIFTIRDTLIPYSKVRDIYVTSGPFQRLLKIGTVTIELVGYTEADIIESEIPGIKNPEEIANKIMKMVAKMK